MAKMDNTATTITVAIAVAALSGLTSLAYKHPKAYQKVSLLLTGIIILGTAVGFSWNISNQWAAIAAEQAADNLCPGKAYEIRKAVAAYVVPIWFFIASAAWCLYVLFLLSFPLWLLDEQPQEPQP